MRVNGKQIRKEIVVDSKLSGYVLTGPEGNFKLWMKSFRERNTAFSLRTLLSSVALTG